MKIYFVLSWSPACNCLHTKITEIRCQKYNKYRFIEKIIAWLWNLSFITYTVQASTFCLFAEEGDATCTCTCTCVHQECIIVLVAYVEIISSFILIFANSIMDDFHINTEDVMVHFWPYLIIINIIVHMYA